MWCLKCDLKTEALCVAVFHTFCSGISVLAHLVLISSTERVVLIDHTGDGEDAGYASANALTFSLVSCCTNGLLLYGVIKENRFTIIPWLVMNGVVMFMGGLITFFLIIFLPIIYGLLFVLIFSFFFGYSWYTVYKYFRSLDPHNPYRQPQTAVYVHPQATTGFTNHQFVPDKSAPDTVVFTPGLPSYNDIVAQPQNV